MSTAIPSTIVNFLKSSKDLSLGYSEITFLKFNEVDEGQVGYHGDAGWRNEWTVIASDQMGDPIFIDTSIDSLPVFNAMHGEGSWDPTKIADSFDSFKSIIGKLRKLSVGRESPVDLEHNPIPQKEVDLLIQEFEMTNPQSEPWYWEGFLEQDD